MMPVTKIGEVPITIMYQWECKKVIQQLVELLLTFGKQIRSTLRLRNLDNSRLPVMETNS